RGAANGGGTSEVRGAGPRAGADTGAKRVERSRAGRRMTRYLRGMSIVWVAFRYGLDELVLNSFQRPWLSSLARVLSFGRDLRAPRGQRLRMALEHLGPIFVKFGQVLSTRRD